MNERPNPTASNEGGGHSRRREVRAVPMTPQPFVGGSPQQVVPRLVLDASGAPPPSARGPKVRSRSAPSRPDAASGTVQSSDGATVKPRHQTADGDGHPVHDPERNVKRVAAHEFAKSAFFHGPFTSSHGAMLTRQPPRLSALFASEARGRDRSHLIVPPSLRHQYQQGTCSIRQQQGSVATDRTPRLLVHHHPHRPRSADGRQALSLRAAKEEACSALHFSFGGHQSVHDVAERRSHSSEPYVVSVLRQPVSEATSLLNSCKAPINYLAVASIPVDGHPTDAADTNMMSSSGGASVGKAMIASAPGKTAALVAVVDEGAEEDDVPPVSWTQVILELVPLAIPSAISMAITYGLSTIPLAFIGSHMGERYLNGASVGCFLISIVAQYPICGLTFALDTLVSHEYGRNNTSDVLGLLLQRGILVNLAFAVPVCFVLTNYSHPILSSIYGVELAVIASDFLRFTPLFLIPLVFFTAFSKFCANQMLPQIPMIAMTFGLIATPLAQQQLIHLGVEGSMLGMAVAAWVQLLVVILLTFAKKETRQTFGAIRIGEALDWEDVSAYLKLALPSALFVAAEGSAFDMSVLLAASISDAQGAAWSAILNSCLPFVSVAGGLSAAACAKVGSSLGAGYPADARRYAFMGVLIASVCSVVNSGIIWTFFDAMLRFYGTEGAALEVANSLLPIVPLMHIADSVQFAFQGVFSGCGQNHKGALILLSSLWAIGFPASCVLAFWLGLGVRGVVMGLTIGLIVESPCMIWAAYRMDWQQLAEDAQEEALEDEEDEEEEEQLFDEVTDGDELVQDEEEAI